MPELPEVETISRQLQERLSGSVLSKIVIHRSDVIKNTADDLRIAGEGKKVLNIYRLGKYLGLQMENKNEIWFHLGMTGQIFWGSQQSGLDPHTHLLLYFSGEKMPLIFRDVRRFGRVFIRSLSSKPPQGFARLGPDALTISRDRFLNLFVRRKASIKALLLNQALICGIGNIYADESLYRAAIRPTRQAGRLSKAELSRLCETLRGLLYEAIAKGGSSIDDYRDSQGFKGSFQKYHRVYARAGKPCIGCGVLIKKTVVAGRSTFYCPQCQK